MNEYVKILEMFLVILEYVFHIRIGSCEYNKKDGTFISSILNMIDNHYNYIYSLVRTGDQETVWEYVNDNLGNPNLIKCPDNNMYFSIENTYDIKTDLTKQVIESIYISGIYEIYYVGSILSTMSIIVKNSTETIISCDIINNGDDTFTFIFDTLHEISIKLNDDWIAINSIFIDDKEFKVVDDSCRYIGSYNPKYVKLEMDDIICEIGFLFRK